MSGPENESGPATARPHGSTNATESTPCDMGDEPVKGQVVSIGDARVKRAAALLRDEEIPDQDEERRAWNDRATLPPAARTATSPASATPLERGAS